MAYPKYRIKATLDEKYEYVFQPQIREYMLFGWHNLISSTKDHKKLTTSVDDIQNVYISRSSYRTHSFTTERAAKMAIKWFHLNLKKEIQMVIDNKDKKKSNLFKR